MTDRHVMTIVARQNGRGLYLRLSCSCRPKDEIRVYGTGGVSYTNIAGTDCPFSARVVDTLQEAQGILGELGKAA
jgi:hypothetical protein